MALAFLLNKTIFLLVFDLQRAQEGRSSTEQRCSCQPHCWVGWVAVEASFDQKHFLYISQY